MDIIKILAKEFNIKETQVEKTIQLIDEGNTIPFIARYRKEVTGSLSDVILRDLNDRLEYLRGLENRKEEILRLIDEQGKLTDELKKEIQEAQVLQRLEDLYKPYKKKKETRASKAKAKGLETLAMEIYSQKLREGSGETIEGLSEKYVNQELEVNNAQEALQGAMDIIAEFVSENVDIIDALRDFIWNKAVMESEANDDTVETVYTMYYHRAENVKTIPNHRVLAINRGEKEGVLKIKVRVELEECVKVMESFVVTDEKSISYPVLMETLADSFKRLIFPSIEREIRNKLTERAETEAIKIFAKNTEALLMTPPVRNKRVIAIDPGYRTGCKVACLDETGKLKAYATIYPTLPKKDIQGAEKTLLALVEKLKAEIIVIGNGTASRETEEMVAEFIKKNNLNVQYTIVNEAGASVYSASKLATEEYPDLDVTTRGAMSLGRRLQDPLAELVKIDPKAIGVGQYQHDINQKQLEGALTDVVENCVNRVGVDLNTASPSLLSYISGVNSAIAKNIVKYREENGKFTDRKQLLKVSKLGEKAFLQCAGFMRIQDGDNPLDMTSVHPESYDKAKALLSILGLDLKDIMGKNTPVIEDRVKELYKGETLKGGIKKIAQEIGAGDITLLDIIEEIKKPARDPRADAPEVVFRNDVKSLEDLEIGTEMSGTVRNVVDFGAFVDIGIKESGLVHISQLSDKFVKHPMEVVSVGDTVKVKIIDLDKNTGKVALTMKGLKNGKN